ncbi:MAG: serine/threonine protein kinase, partial [Deltaproteobacteria bacterium]
MRPRHRGIEQAHVSALAAPDHDLAVEAQVDHGRRCTIEHDEIGARDGLARRIEPRQRGAFGPVGEVVPVGRRVGHPDRACAIVARLATRRCAIAARRTDDARRATASGAARGGRQRITPSRPAIGRRSDRVSIAGRMGASHTDWVPPKRVGEYRLLRVLGRGSMGQVWLAHDTVLDRLVAVKFISGLSTDDADRRRFLTEARAAARVQHPNVIAIYRVGEIGPRPYLISEYVRGDSLDRIARPVAWPRLLDIAVGLARGLAAAHRRGVLHRDLKPANAILSETGEVKLVDFGLAKLVHHGPPDDATSAPGTIG